jgi:hypothetical protein
MTNTYTVSLPNNTTIEYTELTDAIFHVNAVYAAGGIAHIEGGIDYCPCVLCRLSR